MDKTELEGRIILQLPSPVLTPQNTLDAISVALVFVKKEPICLSIDDVKIYKLTWAETKSFAGFCFAFCEYGIYFAGITGSNQIVSFSNDTFIVEECTSYEIPLKGNDEVWYSLVINYNNDNKETTPVGLKKHLQFDSNDGEMLLEFNENTTLPEAIENCYDYLDKL